MSQSEVANVERGVAEANEGIATLHDRLGEMDGAILELRDAIGECGKKVALVDTQLRDQERESRDRRLTYWSNALLAAVWVCIAVEIFIAGTRA